MMRNGKVVVWVGIILLVVFANTASAALMNFWSASPANWNNATVWTEDLGGSWGAQWVPTASDIAEVQSPGLQLNIVATAECQELWLASNNWSIGNPVSVDVLGGGSLSVKTQAWGQKALIGYNGQIVFNVHAGGSVHVQANAGAGGETYMGGENPDGSALLHIQGGTYKTDNFFGVNNFNLAGSASVQIDAGLLDVGWLEIGGGLVDLGLDGQIQIRNNEWSLISDYVIAEKITALGGAGTVMWDYDDTNAGVTTVWAVPEPATMSIFGLGSLVLIRKRRKA